MTTATRRAPLAIAHRGASGREAENSLAAFRAAADLRADAVELDVHATADGVIVVHHDAGIGRRAIASMPAAAVREHRIANGERVPTLAEALAIILPAGLTAFVEVKALAARFDPALLAVFDASDVPDRIAVHSFDHRIIARLGRLRPGLSLGVLTASYEVHPARAMREAGAGAVWPHQDLVDAELVAAVHEAGGVVYPWTVDDPEEIRRLLALGVDGVCGNHPDRARSAIDSLPS